MLMSPYAWLVYKQASFFSILWSSTRGISQIWLQVREKNRKILKFIFGNLLEPPIV